MPQACCNLNLMTAAIARWIDEAQSRPDGRERLAARAGWVAGQIARLGRADLDTPPHLEGLTVWELLAAQSALEAAAR